MLAALLVFCGVLVVLHVRAYTKLSPVDELQHVDYMIKASRGRLVHGGDRVGQEAMREEACRGIDAGAVIPRCDSGPFDPAQFQEEGFNTADVHPPTYYLVTGILARALRAVTGLESLVTAARLVGALWLMGGVVLLWALMADFGAPARSRVPAVLLIVTAPAVLHASATVNNDSTALVAGGGVLLAAVAWERQRVRAWVPAVVAVVAVSLKLSNLIGVGLALAYLVIPTLRLRSRATAAAADSGPRWRSRLAAAGWMAGAVVVGVVAWTGIQRAMAVIGPQASPMGRRFHVSSLSLDQVLPQLPAGVIPLDGAYVPTFLHGVVIIIMMVVVRWLVIGSSFGLAGASERGSREEALSAAAVFCMVVAGPLFVAINFFGAHVFVAIPSRYAMSALPALAVVLALWLRKPWMNAAVGAVAAFLAVFTLAQVAIG